MYKPFAIIFYLFFFTFVANAQEMIFLARSSSNKIAVDEMVQIEYAIMNPQPIQQFQLPNFESFKIIGPIKPLNSTTIINGQKSTKLSYIINLQATKVGTYNLRPAKAILEKIAIHSNAIEIEVTPLIQKPIQKNIPPRLKPAEDNLAELLEKMKKEMSPLIQPKTQPTILPKTKISLSDKIFAFAEADKKNVFQGEQIILNYTIYTQVPIRASLKKIGSPQGFWQQDFALSEEELNQSERVVIKGKEYRKYTLRKVALFPIQTGKLIVPPLEIEGVAELEGQHSRSSDDGLLGLLEKVMQVSSNQQIPFKVKTDTLIIKTQPLPANAPANFNGCVGSYNLESNLSKSELSTDETIELTYTIRGKGNLKLIQAPNTYFSGDFEVNNPITLDSITNTINEIAGYKSFKYIVMPRNPGKFHIPAAQFCYFDPATQEYINLKTNTYDIIVKPGSKHSGLSKNKGLPQDIHDIMNNDDVAKISPKNWAGNPNYWLAYLIPIAIMLVAKIFRIQKNKNATLPKVTLKQTTSTAEQRLQIAHEFLLENKSIEFYNESNKAIWLYLSDRLNTPLSKLDRDNMDEQLTTKNVSADTLEQLNQYSKYSESILYAGASPTQPLQQDYNTCKKILEALEKQFS
jgi:BatD DUF11 like domain